MRPKVGQGAEQGGKSYTDSVRYARQDESHWYRPGRHFAGMFDGQAG